DAAAMLSTRLPYTTLFRSRACRQISPKCASGDMRDARGADSSAVMSSVAWGRKTKCNRARALRPGARRVRSAHDHHAEAARSLRSEEHTSELQSREHLVCR